MSFGMDPHPVQAGIKPPDAGARIRYPDLAALPFTGTAVRKS
jgi:hypothetical protein